MQVGADLCMGSLIKSPGGCIVSTGGYICGRADLVAASAARLTAPGVGIDAGAVSGETLRVMFQGDNPPPPPSPPGRATTHETHTCAFIRGCCLMCLIQVVSSDLMSAMFGKLCLLVVSA